MFDQSYTSQATNVVLFEASGARATYLITVRIDVDDSGSGSPGNSVNPTFRADTTFGQDESFGMSTSASNPSMRTVAVNMESGDQFKLVDVQPDTGYEVRIRCVAARVRDEG